MDRIAVALGSNLGDRRCQPRFFNAAAVGQTSLSPREVLAALLSIEAERGRVRPFPGAPRTLDLDLILFGDCVIADPDLTVPHPRFRERRFVLEPLAQIAPDLRDPLTGKTVGELLAAITPVASMPPAGGASRP
jgi:2-amino-4-hydroxy-6-hydroxymethyldihydropteridine diphosphokinase